MITRNRETWLPLLVAAALAWPLARAGGAVLAHLGDRGYDVLHVPRAGSLAALSPAIRLTAANLYWLSAVQVIGDRQAQARGLEKVFPLVDLVTDLDPRHGYAYQSAGIVLSSAGRLDESDRILEKGVRQGPPRFTYAFYLAFNAFFHRGDYAAAARWAEVAAKTPGASTRIADLATTLKVKSGSPDDAVRFLEEMRETAHDEKTAAAIDEELQVALLQRNFARLDAAVAAFRDATGRVPAVLEELVWAGVVDAIPEDHYGGRYYADATGRVHSTAKDFRMKPAEKPIPGVGAPAAGGNR